MPEQVRKPANAKSTDLLQVNDLIQRCRSRFTSVAGGDAEFSTVLDDDTWPVRVDPERLEKALCNLVANAREALQSGGYITIETRNTVLAESEFGDGVDVVPGAYVQVTVSDDGCGITHEDLPRVFDPLFTTRADDGASGLGLTVVADFVRDAGGYIDLRSEERIGTAAHLYLPRATTP